MTEAVLDASAILAVLRREPGADVVAARMHRSIVGAANLAEVASKLVDLAVREDAVVRIVAGLGCPVVDVDSDLALRAAMLRPVTRHAGLSLGDRLCLALGLRTQLPVLTSDRVWLELDVGVEVVLIR